MLLFIFISVFCCFANSYKFLSINQWGSIRQILQHPSSTPYMKDQVKQVIYNYYEDWAIQQTYKFKEKNRYLCRNICIDELSIYSMKGLIKSIRNFNASIQYPFAKYAEIFIHGALHDAISDLHPITSLPKSYRKSKIWRKNNIKKYIKYIQPKLIGNDNYIIEMLNQKQSTQPTNYSYNYNNLWEIINENLDITSKRIYELKYSYDFNKIRSNKEISLIMGCSEESIRQKLIKSRDIIINKMYKY
jgi:RNA polymerase sigma factor (sigma-70 family)